MEFATQTLAGAVGVNLQPATIPLSQEIIQRTTSHLMQAREISSRLWQLRGRRLGSPPETDVIDPVKPDYSHFAGAYGDKSMDLTDALNIIDRLSSELANRL